jgi:hypothetical protein
MSILKRFHTAKLESVFLGVLGVKCFSPSQNAASAYL